MNRGPEYQVAKDRVKISHFTEKGMDFKGVVHVGTNTGYEIEWYLMMGLKVLGFEPLRAPYEFCVSKYRQAILTHQLEMVNMAIGLETGDRVIHEMVSNRGMDDTGGSTFLVEKHPSEYASPVDTLVRTTTWSDFIVYGGIPSAEEYDCLVIDVEGMELEVLQSMEGSLDQFKGLNIECSRKSWYEGGVDAQVVIDLLSKRGFKQDSPIDEHDDIMFIR